MSKYKVGDKVKVREDLAGGKIYGRQITVENMAELKGKEVTIKSVHNGEEYRIKELGFTWTNEMFEGLVKEVKPNFKLEDEVELISVDDYDKMFGLKIGNKGVIIDISKHSDTCIVRFHKGIISIPIYFHQIKLAEEPSQSIPNKGTIKYRTTDDGTTYATLNGSSLGKSVKGGKDEADNKIGILIATARSLGFDEDKIGGIVDVLFDDDKEILESTNIDRDFKIGDKVIGINNWINGNYPISGIKGVITETEDIFCDYVVKFDSEVEGWGDNNRCLYVKKENMKLLPISKDEEIESLKQENQELKDKLKDIQNTIKSMYIKVGGKIV